MDLGRNAACVAEGGSGAAKGGTQTFITGADLGKYPTLCCLWFYDFGAHESGLGDSGISWAFI